MNSEIKPGPQQRAPCALCAGTGWKTIWKDGTSHVTECDCRRSNRGFERAGEILRKSGVGSRESGRASIFEFRISALFRERPRLKDFFEPNDLMVAELVLGRVGEAQAIKLDEIAQTLWPEVYQQGDAARSNLARQIKAIVSKLRRRPISLRIISSRRPPYGYFMARTPEEWVAYTAELWKHARAWLELVHETADDHWLEEQLGQLQLAWANSSVDSAEHAEVKG